MSPHRAYEDHVCSFATMTRGAWRTLVNALSGSADIKEIIDVRGSEEIVYTNGTTLHIHIQTAF